MGRFYQTSNPVFVDNKMLQLPYETMGAILQSKDTDFKNVIGEAQSLEGMLKANALSQQQDKLNEIFTGYESQIKSLAEDLQKDPLNYEKKLGKIRELKNTLHKDFTRGDVATIQGNYDKFINYQEEQKKRVAEGEIQQADLNANINKTLGDFQGITDGQLSHFNITELNKYANAQTIADGLGDNYKADKTSKSSVGSDGTYLYENKITNELVDANTIYTDVYKGLLNNDEFNNYYDQLDKLGIAKNKTKDEVAKEEAKRVASKFGFNQEDTIKNISVDSSYTYTSKKEEDHKDMGLFYNNTGLVEASVSSTEEGLAIKSNNYSKTIQNNYTELSSTIYSLPQFKNTTPEQKDELIKMIIDGDLSNEGAVELGFANTKQLDNYFNINRENNILLNQNSKIKELYNKEKSINPGLTYEDFSNKYNIKNQNPTNVKYSLDGYGFSTSQKKEIKKFYSENILSGYLDFSGNTDLIGEIRKMGGEPGKTKYTLNELIELGVLKEKIKSSSKNTNTSTKDDYSEKDENGNIKPTNAEVDETVYFSSPIEDFKDLEISPESIAVGNAKDQYGNVNFAMKIKAGQGKQYIATYPTSKLGSAVVEDVINQNFKVIKLQDILNKGTKVPSYDIMEGQIKVETLNGVQHLFEYIDPNNKRDHGALSNISQDTYKKIADKIFR